MVVDPSRPHKLGPDWTRGPRGPYTFPVPASRADARLLLFAAAAVVVAGLAVAGVLLLATGRAGSPTRYRPFEYGPARALEQELRDGGPFYVPDPFGGSRSILFALEDGQVVALSAVRPGTKKCSIRWRGSIDRFVDCKNMKLVSEQLERFPSEVEAAGENKGILLVDLRKRMPAPQPL